MVLRTASMSYAGFAPIVFSEGSSFYAGNLASPCRFGLDVTISLLSLSLGWSRENHLYLNHTDRNSRS